MPRERKARRDAGASGPGGGSAGAGATPPRELIVVTKPVVAMRTLRGLGIRAAPSQETLGEVLAAQGATLVPLFGGVQARRIAGAEALNAPLADSPDLMSYYKVEAPDEQLDALAERLRQLDSVDAAYVKPPALPPLLVNSDAPPLAEEPPAVTPDFMPRQGYLDAAPAGVDARFAWTVPGGSGSGVRIVDVEGAWRFTHEDLRQNQGGIVAGMPSTDLVWRNHGTAVLGVFSGDRTGYGITGIAPDANVCAVSIFGNTGSAAAIRQGADLLGPGDILLIELHRPGPRYGFGNPPDGRAGPPGYIPVEWWPDDFDAIRYAVSKGVVVVEAGGNGWEDLDDSLYNTAAPGFPADWTNPFNRANRDSGAILVGAGVPPPGTHGRDNGTNLSRCSFSNWGGSFDVQGWGLEVTTCGYGFLQGGSDEDAWYTDSFNGTSSASPVVVGVLACVQGARAAAGKPLLTPAEARDLLRATGSAQQDGPDCPASQRIGNRPDLRQLLGQAAVPPTWAGVQFTGTVPANETGRWFTHDWPAQWHVIWTIVPTSPVSGLPQIKWQVQVERVSANLITYWIDVTNLTSSAVAIEARYAVVGS